MHLQTHTQPRVKVISVISGHSASIHCQYNSLHINDIDSTVLRATRHSLSPWGITARPSLPRADGELLCKNLVARGELTLHEEFVELLQGFAYLLICPHISYQEVMGSPACLPTNLEFVTWKFGKCLTSSDHLKNLPNILLSRHVWWHYRSPCLSPWTCSSPGIVPLQRQAGWQKASHKEECVDGWMHAFDVFRTRWNNISIEAGKGEDYYSGMNILCWQIQIFAIERQETSFNMPLIRQKSRRLCRCNIEPRH